MLISDCATNCEAAVWTLASASPGRSVGSTFLPKGRPPPRVRDRRPSLESRRSEFSVSDHGATHHGNRSDLLLRLRTVLQGNYARRHRWFGGRTRFFVNADGLEDDCSSGSQTSITSSHSTTGATDSQRRLQGAAKMVLSGVRY